MMDLKKLTVHNMKIYFYTIISVILLSIITTISCLAFSYLILGSGNLSLIYNNLFKVSNSFIHGCDNMAGTTLRYSMNVLFGIPSCKEIHIIYYELLQNIKNLIITTVVIFWYPIYNYWYRKEQCVIKNKII